MNPKRDDDMRTFPKEILLNTLHENIPCLPEKALRERGKELEKREGKKTHKSEAVSAY